MSGAVYGLDTNSLLRGWYETYRPTNFASFWTRLNELIVEGRALICEEVAREVAAKDDGLAQWIKDQPSHFVVPLEMEQVAIARQLATDFPVLAKERLGRKRADGFVIALAMWKGYIVVTDENRRGPEKIPNLCDQRGIACISLADLIEREGWTF